MMARDPDVVIREAAPHLAFLATESMYAEQPDLWDLGEKGRHHTLNDFTLHFQAVAEGEDAFRGHVDYCHDLFRDREFPRKWLDDAWAYMGAIGKEHLDRPALDVLLDRLASVVGGRDDE
jgi:hypothetical protein